MNTKLNKALAIIAKAYGENACIKFSDYQKRRPKLDVISSGCLSLDVATDIGGFPKACMIEIAGVESSGKTTIALHTIVQAQQAGLVCAFIDMENAIDYKYAKALGVNFDNLLFSQPDSGEEATEIAKQLAIGNVDLIVIDSIAALVPLAESEAAMNEQQIGLQARLVTKFCRSIRPLVRRNGTCLIMINQLRDKIGAFGFGDKEQTPGGRALKFYCDIRVDVRNIGQIKGKNNTVAGNNIRARIKKNKVGRPFGTAEYTIRFGKGIDTAIDLFNVARTAGVIRKIKGKFDYNGKMTAPDEKSFSEALTKKPKTTATIRKKTLAILFAPDGGE